jgi:hypothetical protein
MPRANGLVDPLGVTEVRHGGKLVAEEDNVVQRDGHTSTSKRMPHVPGVTEKDNAVLA